MKVTDTRFRAFTPGAGFVSTPWTIEKIVVLPPMTTATRYDRRGGEPRGPGHDAEAGAEILKQLLEVWNVCSHMEAPTALDTEPRRIDYAVPARLTCSPAGSSSPRRPRAGRRCSGSRAAECLLLSRVVTAIGSFETSLCGAVVPLQQNATSSGRFPPLPAM